MSKSVNYKGPSVHNRVLTRRDFEFGLGIKDVPEDFPDLRWVSNMEGTRLPVELPEDTPKSVLDFFENEPHFEIVGEDGGVESKAHPLAGEINADGTSKAVTDGDGLDHSVAPGEEAKPLTSGSRPGR